uniref:Tyrosine-protein phosphatase domain-containing protein n=1 Tax=Angiostrongylus cantonensis TaxID=6313 RepID=A0A158P601_ANGCA
MIKGERSDRNHRQPLGDNVDRMHWDVTVCILCVFALLVGSKQHFGNPIDCFISAEIDNIDMSMIVTESSELNMERCSSDRSSKLNRVADYIFSYFYYRGIARIMFSLLKQQFFPCGIAGPLEFNDRLSHFPYFPLEVGCNYTKLILITSVNIVMFIGSIMNKSRRQEAILSILKEKNDDDFMNDKRGTAHRFIDSFMGADGVLLMQFITAKAGPLTCRDVLQEVWLKYYKERGTVLKDTKNKESRESPSDAEIPQERCETIIAKAKRKKMKHDRMSRSTHKRGRRRATAAHIDEPSMLKTERDDHDGVPKAKSPRRKENVDGALKAGSSLKTPAEKSSKSQSTDNRFIWAQNLLLHATTASIRKEFIQNKKYEDVICMDENRVILKQRPSDNDYIHANWIGPLHETLEDFWHMIVTEQCCVVVMLCPLRDESILCKMRNEPALKIRNDHAAPLDPSPVTTMVKFARQLCNNNPIVVHCSAGIGPSVCFIGIDYVAQKVKEDSSVKMLDMLVHLRNQRLQGIQSIIQYTFLHDKIMPREGKYSEFLNSYVRMMTRYNRRVAAFNTKEVEEAHQN